MLNLPIEVKELMRSEIYEKKHLRSRILDELSDGQWHPLYKINKKIERGTEKARQFKEKIGDELSKLVEDEILIAGNNESFRFNSDELVLWRNISTNSFINERQYLPRWFGGILEDDGWLLSELKKYDLVHFRADSSLTRTQIHKAVGGKLSLIQIDDGLFRVFSHSGEEIFSTIQEFKDMNPSYDIRGMRLERNLRRRELEDLPPRFVDDLVKYYGQFAKVLLRAYMSSINKHLSDPDDIQQQIYLWVLDAIQRYDAETSIPFAAYLSASLKKWVFNLNRKAYGRAVADAELKHARAIAEFKANNGRDPRPEELAEFLQEDVSATKKDSAVINTVFNLRNISTINSEESEIQLPADNLVEDNIDGLINNTLLSAAITTATKHEMKTKYRDISGLVGIYYDTWGADYRSKRIKMWSKTAKTQESMKKVMNAAKEILDKDRG